MSPCLQKQPHCAGKWSGGLCQHSTGWLWTVTVLCDSTSAFSVQFQGPCSTWRSIFWRTFWNGNDLPFILAHSHTASVSSKNNNLPSFQQQWFWRRGGLRPGIHLQGFMKGKVLEKNQTRSWKKGGLSSDQSFLTGFTVLQMLGWGWGWGGRGWLALWVHFGKYALAYLIAGYYRVWFC